MRATKRPSPGLTLLTAMISCGALTASPAGAQSVVPRYGGVAPKVDGAGQVEQWVYAGYDRTFLRTGKNTDFPPETMLRKMFTRWRNAKGVEIEPVFSKPLQFALSAYANGSAATTVTHFYEYGSGGLSTEDACRVE